MRIGLLGPAYGDTEVLREATEFLVGDLAVDQALYLGIDKSLDDVVASWAAELGGEQIEDAFLDRAAKLAVSGTAAELEGLIDADLEVRRLGSVRKVPPPPARAIEMIDDRILVIVHDKAVLDEEDIANAHVIVFGKSDEMLLKRFGPRYFFTPGPLAARKVGVIELEGDGRIAIAAYDPSGAPLWREVLQGRGTKMTVAG